MYLPFRGPEGCAFESEIGDWEAVDVFLLRGFVFSTE
jgi:hypothetical protein